MFRDSPGSSSYDEELQKPSELIETQRRRANSSVKAISMGSYGVHINHEAGHQQHVHSNFGSGKIRTLTPLCFFY